MFRTHRLVGQSETGPRVPNGRLTFRFLFSYPSIVHGRKARRHELAHGEAGTYALVAGARRYRALKIAKRETIPATVQALG